MVDFGFDSALAVAADALGFGGAGAPGPAGTSIEIAQIEGDRPTVVELRARAMPYQGVAWPVEQHSKLTWYPGNPVATQQLLGPRELSTTFSGMWKSRFIAGAMVVNGDKQAVTTAFQAVQLLERLARAGKAVRVQWLGEVRTGIIKRFTPTFDREHDVAWEIEFEWNGRDDELAPRAVVEASAPAGNDLFKLLNTVEDVLTLAPDLAASFVASIVTQVNAVRDAVALVVDSFRAIESLVNLPNTVMGSMINAVGQIARQTSELVRRIGGPRSSAVDVTTAVRIKGAFTAPTAPGRTSSGAAVTTSAVAGELAFEAWRRTLVAALANLRFQTQALLDDAQNRLQPRTTRVVTVAEGQTLYQLATTFYGSPDFANFLASVNRLTSIRVPPGTLLRVPARPFGAVATIEPVTDRPGTC